MMPDMNPNLPKVGDRVKVVVPPHEKGHDVGVVRQVVDGALGIEFDALPGVVHHWYVPSEVMVTDAAAEMDDQAAKKKKKPMDMKMGAPAVQYRYQTVDLPPLGVRAEVGSVNDDARTVELIFSTGAAVERMDWWTGKRYLEVLSLKPGHVRLDRLNAGGPLLNAHSAYSLADVLGTVAPGSARIEKAHAVATVRFSKRADVEPIWQDVRDGIIRNVSVGYRVHRFEEDAGKDNKLPVRTAVDWEPYEISMVPMPADAGARVRTGDKTNTNTCVIAAITQDADRNRLFKHEIARAGY